ncbi:unnamed protein product [Rotaria sp. Silwood2]|nr:unnamed protein product [Rotaria sp. Silwood2]CAF4101407.1 unnamed protein product [Rotaria sp. Silwood2]
MSVEVYSECRIQLSPIPGQNIDFARCLIELRQYDIGDYALRAIDLNNHKSEIFTCPLVGRNQYTFAPSVKQPDMIDITNNTYRLWLNKNSRDKFHEVLRTCLEEFIIVKDNDNNLSSQQQNQPQSKPLLSELCTKEDEPYYRNEDPFECITCLETITKGEGILFYNCLHPFCKQCLLRMIETCTEPIIKCPHDDCTAFITERELRGVANDQKADQKVIDRLNDVSMRFAANRNKTFHCREYQDMKLQETNNDNVRKDTEHLEAMIKNKEVMYCPGCRIIIQKISGCDWIQCSQCKIEICWPTQGPRWGPKGRGDTSGGCRCRMDNGKLCVPNSPARIQTQQPQAYFRPINNSFNLLPSEKVYREWDYHDNMCCCNNANYTALTDIRLLTRYEENICSENCSEPSHTDSAIFLRDIDQMRECRGEQPSFFFLLWITLVCAWPCYVIRRVFCPKPKCLEIFGSFGSEMVRIKREDMPVAQVDISTAVINSKLVGRS